MKRIRKKMIKKWETIDKNIVGDFKIFSLQRIKRRHPDWNKESSFVALDSPQWVNIIPITPDKKVIFVEQYRHGIDEITLEVPGGLIEPGEAPGKAGMRECAEETGFMAPEPAILLGENYPNPAFLNNKCYSYVWFDCERTKEQSLDGNEDIQVVEIPLDNIQQMILGGKIQHSLVLTAFFFYSMRYGF